MSKWMTYKLGEIADINMGQSPKSEFYNFEKKGMPFLQGNRTFGRIYPTIDTYCISPIKIADDNLVLFSVRAPVGDINIANQKICIGRGLCSFNAKNRNNKFLFYLLKNIKNEIISKESGTVFGSVNKSNLAEIKVSIPDDSTQLQIASILSSLDDKIELNLQMNQTLETMAQAIFKEWFFDFNFPGFDGEFVDGLPNGWRMGNLGDEFKITMGQSPPGESFSENNEGTIFYQGRTDFGFRFPENRIYTTSPNRMAYKFDTLVCVRAPVGDINMAIENCCIGRGLSAVIHKSNAYSYTYYSMKSIDNIFKGFESEGTVFGSINKTNFENIEFIIPENRVILEFENIVNLIDEKILNNTLEIKTLTQIRDSLLPRLMCGKIEIKE